MGRREATRAYDPGPSDPGPSDPGPRPHSHVETLVICEQVAVDISLRRLGALHLMHRFEPHVARPRSA